MRRPRCRLALMLDFRVWGSEVKLEWATQATLDDIVELGREMHAESALTYLPLSEERLRATLGTALDDDRGRYCLLLARSDDGTPAGWLFGAIDRPWFTSALIAHDFAFFVSPRFRGGEAASMLLDAFRRWAEKRDAAVVNISQRVGVEMERFQYFMQREGFEARGMNFSLPLDPPR